MAVSTLRDGNIINSSCRVNAPNLLSQVRGVSTQGIISLTPDKIVALLYQFENIAWQDFMLGSPRADQLLTLTQFNIMRALICNTKSLGWSLSWLECDDLTSPWSTAPTNLATNCPAHLQPTTTQFTIKHHPWIDLWPIPKMRDNLLQASGCYDEEQLCNSLVEFCDQTNDQCGLIVWGEPWDQGGWEVSEIYLQNWAWTIKGCTELQASTNSWRARRNEAPLKFET